MSAYLKVTINGEVVMDGDPRSWEQRQPEFIANALNNMGKGASKPYMRSLMLVIAEAAMTQTYTVVDVKSDGSGWSLNVRYAIELEA